MRGKLMPIVLLTTFTISQVGRVDGTNVSAYRICAIH